MDYLLFPEYHKPRPGETECAIHFHMLANADGLNLSDSGKQTKNGQAIFNLSGWKYGFSTAIELDGRPAIIKYVTKYITKGNAKISASSIFQAARRSNGKSPPIHEY